MKILHLYPRQNGTRPVHVTIPKRYTYFWEISAYLGKHHEVTSLDCIDPTYSIYDISKEFLQEDYKVLVLLVRTENLKQSLRFAEFIKSIKPSTKIIIYGDIINHIPGFFKESEFIDAIVVSGDWEISILSYLDYIENKGTTVPTGIYLVTEKKTFQGSYLENEWSFPNPDKAPSDYYNSLNGRKQLSFTVARGCPFNCSYCLSVATYGVRERRKSTDDVIAFMSENANRFDSFKLFAPTFNFNQKWVIELCSKIIERGLKFSWCCSSRIDLLDDEEVVKLMAKSGCYKVSVGIETINDSSKYLNKTFTKDLIKRVAGYFKKYDIVLKGLIMLGVPKQTKKDIYELFCLLKDNDITIRPTSFSPLKELAENENLTTNIIQSYDKFTFYKYGVEGIDKESYYKLIIDPNNFEEILNGKN
ncbi:MAG: radical SAM protein [Candidatus Gracilibacteria bacterium]|nr:radical SAM protein [Candidatus Gracilibacteria bacterium]